MLYLRFGYYDFAADEHAAYLASGLLTPEQAELDEVKFFNFFSKIRQKLILKVEIVFVFSIRLN